MRRSLIYARDLAAGTTVLAGDLDAKRPGTGLEPAGVANIIGKKLTKAVYGDTLVAFDDFEQ
jgi:N-acetylneuraminate synthase/N,N'-diacetyllegionaminate synthase